MNFLDRVLPDRKVKEFTRRAVGYTLTGYVDDEKFFMCHGVGANGKSTFANIMAAMMGEYAGSFGASLVTRSKNENEAARMIARLPGLRLALVNETAVGDVWEVAPTGKRGRQPDYSDAAIQTCLTMKVLFGMALTRPNQVWAMDITYIPMARGFIYLAAVIDWCLYGFLAFPGKLSASARIPQVIR